MIILDKRKAVSMLKAKAKAEPDKVVACHYVDTSLNPVCIVGHILHDLKPEIVETLERLNYAAIDNTNLLVDIDYGGIHITRGAAQVMRIAQLEQDKGRTWGEAVESALS